MYKNIALLALLLPFCSQSMDEKQMRWTVLTMKMNQITTRIVGLKSEMMIAGLYLIFGCKSQMERVAAEMKECQEELIELQKEAEALESMDKSCTKK